MAKSKTNTEEVAKETPADALAQIDLPLHVILALAIVFSAFLWLLIPSLITLLLFGAATLLSSVFLMILSAIEFKEYPRERLNIIPAFVGIMLAAITLVSSDMLLSMLFTAYMVLALLFSSKILKLQTAVIIAIAITAIMFRVYPALPDGSNSMAGHLLSMDDPYYHYKYTEDLYTRGTIAPVDHRTYPPDGKPAPHYLVYYSNTYLAFVTGMPLQHIMLFSIVIISAFGAVMLYFLLKELTGDWKSGAIAGFLFATLPAVLSKSVAGGTEYTPVGLVFGIFAMYLLVKSMRLEGSKGLKLAVLSGFAFLLLYLTWIGSQMIFALPLLGVGAYFYISTLFDHDNWNMTKNVFVAVLVFNVLRSLVSSSLSLDIIYLGASAIPVVIGIWAESIRARLAQTVLMKGILLIGFLGLMLVVYGIFWESYQPNVAAEVLAGLAIAFGVIALTLLLSIISRKQGLSLAPIRLSKLESSIRSNITLLCTAIVVLAIVFVIYEGPAKLARIPQDIHARVTGEAIVNFMVQKTISEQGALATGSVSDKLCAGAGTYGAGEFLTIPMLFAVIGLIGYYLLLKKKDEALELMLPYLVGLMFFSFLWSFVWSQARLSFSVSLGFIITGAMAGLLMPKNLKELGSIKIVPFLLVLLALLYPTFYGGVVMSCNGNNYGSSWGLPQTDAHAASGAAHTEASVDPAWFEGVKWLDSHIVPGQWVNGNYVNGDYVFTWWDYGHFITALSRSTVITDPLQANEDYIMRTARFFYNTTTEDEAMAWLMTQPWNAKDANGEYPTKYIILDYSLVGKASALAFLGTNYYQDPNGYTAVNGTCQVGEVCQNVENGLYADVADGKYTCKDGVVCTRDVLTGVSDKKCCEASPTKCCNMTFDYNAGNNPDITAKILRSPGTPVYGQYELQIGGYACRPEFTTSTDQIYVVDNGERKVVKSRFLYTGNGGLPYGDSGEYPAFIIFTYADGSQKLQFISSNCDTKDYDNVMGLKKDLLLNVGYARKLADGSYAPQIFIHVPQKWLNAMFTKLYLQDAEGLKYISLVADNQTKEFYPSVKIYKITYPGEIPVVKQGVAKTGDVVEVDYTLKLENGTMIETSIGNKPLRFTLGVDPMIQGFVEAVTGMAAGESKTVTVPPEKAYGFGSNPLANKTLIFDITLLSINPTSSAQANITNELNMTFDRYDPVLNKQYGINRFPTLVWDCQIKRFGIVTDEMGALRKLTCFVNKGEPKDFCAQAGIIYQNGKIETTNATYLKAILNGVTKIGNISCAASNSTTIQAFYSGSCEQCAVQKPLLDELKSELGSFLNLTYYCAGNETYCSSHTL